jgi:hypothetical protein
MYKASESREVLRCITKKNRANSEKSMPYPSRKNRPSKN